MSALHDWLYDGAEPPDDPAVPALARDLAAIDAAACALVAPTPAAWPDVLGRVDALIRDDARIDAAARALEAPAPGVWPDVLGRIDVLVRDDAAIDAAARALPSAQGRGGGDEPGDAARTTAAARAVAAEIADEVAAHEAAEHDLVLATTRAALVAGVPEAVAQAALARVLADEVAAGQFRDHRAITAAAGQLPPIVPPAHVIARLEAAIAADPRPVVAWRAPAPANRPVTSPPWGRVAAGLLAAAAVVLVGLWGLGPSGGAPTPAPGNPDDFVVRGDGGPRPAVDLRLTVREPDGQIARLRRGEHYDPGDVVLFHVDLDRPSPVVVLRVDADHVDAVWSDAAPAGGLDLRKGDDAVGWSFEAGESSAVFVAVAGEGVSAAQMAGSLPPGDDPAGVCTAVEALGFGCAAIRVEEVR